MISNLQPNTTYAVHLRASSSSGGKDWVGSVTSQGEIHTYWGKTGQIIQHAGKPGDAQALNKIISQKMIGKDKYTQVDEFHPQQGWHSQRKQTPAPSQPKAPKPVAAPIVDWVEAPNASIKWDF
jgi:hypothetical protein